ncbi:MAG: Rossmann-like domain-containing protein [Candidatus Nezhaarchaeales archaeon]
MLSGDENPRVIEWADVVCITGSAIVNGTLFDLLKLCKKKGVHVIVYGVTVKGAAKIMGLPVFCPLSCDSLGEES